MLDVIFGSKPSDEFILVWTLQDKKSYWFKTPEDIPVDKFTGDTYFGLGSSKKNYGERRRCPANEISGIGAVWLDLDVLDEAHKKGNLPESREKALELLSEAFDEKATYIIDSGHGLQVYWLFDDWLVIDDSNRDQAKELLRAFNTRWRDICAKHGYDADSVCDLSRVMRLPGTKNYKNPLDVKDVTIIKNHDNCHSFYDLHRQYAYQSSFKPEQSSFKPFKPEQNYKISKEKWEILCSLDNRVQLTWNLSRKDLKDQSPSSYTIALGRLAYNNGWSEEETFKLMYVFRKSKGWEIKPHMLKITVQSIVNSPSGFGPENKEEATTKDTLETISEKIGINIKKIIKYNSTPSAYILETLDGKLINLGTIEGITEQKKFRNTIASSIEILPNKFKVDTWEQIVRNLLLFIEHRDSGQESREDGQCREWINSYLSKKTIHKNIEDGIKADEPFSNEKGEIFVTISSLRSFIAIHLQDRIEPRKLALMLSSIGAEPTKIKNTSVWKLKERGN